MAAALAQSQANFPFALPAAKAVDAHAEFHRLHRDHKSNRWILGTALVAGAIIAAPLMGGLLFNAGMASDAVGEAALAATTACQGAPQGAASVMAGFLSHTPLIGAGLAEGGIVNTITSATLGIGGMVLGHYIARRDDGTSSIRWGNVIKTAALVTSFLVASPAIFTALSMGFTFMGVMAGASPEFLTGILGVFGTTGFFSIGAAGLGVIGAHFFTCGPAIAGVAATAGSHEILNKQDKNLATQSKDTAHEGHNHSTMDPSVPPAVAAMQQNRCLLSNL